MTNTLLIGDKRRIDFETPFEMTEEQKKDFKRFLESMFEAVEFQEVTNDDFRVDRLGSKEIPATWTAKEYYVLLKFEEPEVVAAKLGRTIMSVNMRLGNVIPRLLIWCDEKGISMEDIRVKDIEAFLKEREEMKLRRKEERKQKTEIARKIDRMSECCVGDSSMYGGECKDGFNQNCFSCPHNPGYIKSQEDIKKFNGIWHERFEH